MSGTKKSPASAHSEGRGSGSFVLICLTAEQFRDILHQGDDGKMLGTDALALPAADAVGCLAAVLDESGIEILRAPVIRIPVLC